LPLEKIVPVGHDAGGPAAINFILNHPDRVSALCLLNTFYGAAPTLQLLELIALFATPGLKALVGALLKSPRTARLGVTMTALSEAVGREAFSKNNRFSLAMFEFIALSLSKAIQASDAGLAPEFVRAKVASVAGLPQAQRYSGSGVRGTQRLANFVVPLAERHFAQDQ
jgi:pimeloyl-ACP methyl ester carboxylesterase